MLYILTLNNLDDSIYLSKPIILRGRKQWFPHWFHRKKISKFHLLEIAPPGYLFASRFSLYLPQHPLQTDHRGQLLHQPPLQFFSPPRPLTHGVNQGPVLGHSFLPVLIPCVISPRLTALSSSILMILKCKLSA